METEGIAVERYDTQPMRNVLSQWVSAGRIECFSKCPSPSNLHAYFKMEEDIYKYSRTPFGVILERAQSWITQLFLKLDPTYCTSYENIPMKQSRSKTASKYWNLIFGQQVRDFYRGGAPRGKSCLNHIDSITLLALIVSFSSAELWISGPRWKLLYFWGRTLSRPHCADITQPPYSP